MHTHGYAAQSADTPLAPFSFDRRDLRADDIALDILFCGVCHSDLHVAKGEWGNSIYPSVPGHEIVGVGCMVDSCGHCSACDDGEEQYCETTGFVGTYNAHDLIDGTPTYGGYSKAIVVKQHFVLKIGHDESELAGVAPLLCAGITTYSPLKKWGAGPGKKVGIVGIGGLGHMGLKIARAMGAHVVAFTTSPAKIDDALALGAHEVVVSKDAEAMKAHTASFDLILNMVAAPHDLDAFITLLKRDGTMVMLGVPDSPHPSPSVGNLIFGRKSLAGSLIGGVAETQEMLDFCKEHGLTADIEIIPIQEINTAYDRMLKSDVKYRFVIDLASLEAA